MGRARLLTFLFLAACFVGCTPTSENIARRPISRQPEVLSDAQGGAYGYCLVSDGRSIDVPTRSIIQSYGSTIHRYADMYGFDWRLIVAVMRVESGFSATAESQKGAAGFMQMMPTTSEEVGKSLDIDDMAHPSNNIKGGVYYLARLFRLFESSEQTDRVKLTLAAYNAGIGRIYDAQELAAYFHESPAKWSAVREALPLLSKRYYTLHKNIWSQDRPKSGWFGNSRETIAYVDKIMRCYDEYRESLN